MEIAIDLGKWKSYVVMEDNGRVVKEGYMETTNQGWHDIIRFFWVN
ncbi:MAG: hypothetical protein M1611_02030 [Candidatus Marsarchaeota archaeon]|nr:hypothetical protein [Candidatus Marsarchaeota archaeon]